jgi:serine/threonine protein kinase
MSTFPFLPLNHYGTKMKTLGQGTYGSVYMYQDNERNQFAIKKQLRDEDDNSIKQSTLREIVIMKELCCNKNIVSIIDVIIDPKAIYMVMPLGVRDLSTILYMTKIEDLISFAYNIASGIAYYTSKNILHRDLKPQNIIIYSENSGKSAKIADFGLARSEVCLYLNRSITK